VSADSIPLNDFANNVRREEEDPDDYPFPLTLKTKKTTSAPGSGTASPALNGTATGLT
jgi:hypothetical protein